MNVWEFALPIITAVTAIIAVIISVVGICKSNKQSLFDRRLKVYLIIKWMKSLCDQNNSIAKNYLENGKNGPMFSIDYMFDLMTNCTYLEDIQGTLSHALENEFQRKYLLKMEALRNTSEETRLIFPENLGYPLGDFILYYQEMLVSMYKYKIALNGIEKKSQELNVSLSDGDELENSCRTTLIKNLSRTFELADRLMKDGTLQKATKQIKL